MVRLLGQSTIHSLIRIGHCTQEPVQSNDIRVTKLVTLDASGTTGCHVRYFSNAMKSCLAFILTISMAIADDNIKPRLAALTKQFDQMEAEDNAVELHTQWLKSPAGQEDIAFLTAHYNDLSASRKQDIPQELARTGLVVTVPLLEKALTASDGALAGVFYACIVGKLEAGFGKAVAPLVAPWAGRSRTPSRDSAIIVLPILDPDVASKVLFTERFIGESAPTADQVLESCNDAGLAVPLPIIESLILAWEDKAVSPNAEFRIWAGYAKALTALAVHDSARALAKAEAIMKTPSFKTDPSKAEYLRELPLLAAGLSGLYDKVGDYFDKHGQFQDLPEAAQFYFAVIYFESDVSNGGMSQALHNSVGDHLPLVRKAYQAIGDTQSLDWLDWMLKPFGSAGPSPDRNIRLRQMNEMNPSYFDQESKLSEDWQAKPEGKQPDVPPSWALSIQVSKHAAEIKRALAKP